MVLSNKKLKQKLRAQKSDEETPKPKKQLVSSNQKSKREKRREKMVTLQQHPDGENDQNAPSDKIKKRKREIKGVSDGGVDEDLVEKKKKMKKKKKKMKKKKGKVGNKEKELEVENGGVLEWSGVPNGDFNDSQGNIEDKKKVYVGGIPYYSTEDDIRSFFDHCGTITGIDCMMFSDSNKFRGIAIISFKTEEAAKRALALDGSDMGGLYLIIKPYKTTRTTKTTTTDFSPPILTGYNRIYAGNLSWEITEDDLKNLFAGCNISSIRFGEDKESGEFKGYAHVDFADNDSLTKALKLDQSVVCGRPVRIRGAVPPKKGTITNLGSVSQGTITNAGSVSQGTITNAVSVSTAVNADAATNNNEGEVKNNGVTSSKIKRRTCYECGERGHISSLCPKKQSTEENNPNGG